MFQFPWFPSCTYFIQCMMLVVRTSRFPYSDIPGYIACSQLPEAYQCPTSFIGIWRQGIHRKLLVASPRDAEKSMLFQAFAINCLLFCMIHKHRICYHTSYKWYSIVNVLKFFICCQMMERSKFLLILPSYGNPPHALTLVEMRGLEPLTSSLQRRRSPD